MRFGESVSWSSCGEWQLTPGTRPSAVRVREHTTPVTVTPSPTNGEAARASRPAWRALRPPGPSQDRSVVTIVTILGAAARPLGSREPQLTALRPSLGGFQRVLVTCRQVVTRAAECPVTVGT